MNRHWWGLLPDLVRREIRSRLVNATSGWLWLVVTPLLLLAVYGFVFGVIFQARVPAGLEMPFVAWLAVALWPWLAFSEGVLRGSQAILQHASLISKVAIPRQLLVVSAQTAVFILHLVGYLVVLLALQLLGIGVTWQGLPLALLVLASFYVFGLGLGLGLAALQVYVRDLEQLLPTFMMFWFFMTPILYAPELLSETLASVLVFNPATWWIEEIRATLLHGKWLPDVMLLVLLVAGGLSLWLGSLLFARLSPCFEDFL